MNYKNVQASDGIRKNTQTVFGGYDHRGVEEGTIYECLNLGSDHYPLLSTRPRRRSIETLTEPQGIIKADELCLCYGGKFYYGGVEKGSVSTGRKDMVCMGAYILIFPDKKVYNQKTGVFESLESQWTGQSITLTNGTIYGEEADANTIEAAGAAWSTYFREGDAVTISGCTTHEENNKTAIIREIDGDKLRFSENCFTLNGEEGLTPYTETGTIKIERTVPDMDFLCANENRLWGCKGDTIYASALGDPFNFNTFDGVDTDSWAVDTGTAGAFTGCVSYLGYPIFFKQDAIFKVYGDRPSNFQSIRTMSMGVMAGCHRSLAIAGEVCFYLSRNGVCAYSGGTPRLVSEQFGDAIYKDGVAGSDGRKYYLCCKDESNAWVNFVYDTQNGTWNKEDGGEIIGYAMAEDLHYLKASGEHGLTGHIITGDGTAEQTLSWAAEFSDEYGGELDRKRLTKLQLRTEMPTGATMSIQVSYDGGAYENAVAITGTGKKEHFIAVSVKRCDHFRVKLTGSGEMKVYAIAREYSVGSER